MPHFDSLYNTARWMLHDETDAEDLIQETYLKAYQSFDRFTQGTDCKAWLFQILRNTFINAHHRKKKEANTISLEDTEWLYAQWFEGDNSVSMGASYPDVFQSLMLEDVKHALNKLPEYHRLAVIFAHIEGFSYKEIAKIMGCPVGTVMTWVYRGRRMLQELLIDYGKDARSRRER